MIMTAKLSAQGKKSYKEQQRMSRPGGNCTYAPHAGHPTQAKHAHATQPV